MVGKFFSDDLRREAVAHENFSARQGIPGRCLCLLASFLIILGVGAVVSTFQALIFPAHEPTPWHRRTSEVPYSLDIRHATDERVSGFSSHYTSDPLLVYETGELRSGFDMIQPVLSQPKHLGLDFSLIAAIIIALIACCFFGLPRANGLPRFLFWSPWTSTTAYPSCHNQLSQPGPSGPARGRVVDVKCGEMRGFGGVRDGCWQRESYETVGGRAPATMGGGSWNSAVPSAHTHGGLHSSVHSPGAWAGFGTMPNAVQAGSPLPSERDVSETYHTFGVQLQQLSDALMTFMDQKVISPLVRQLDESDTYWRSVLAQQNVRLSFEAPQHTFGGVQNRPSELSIFEQHLPPWLSPSPQANQDWRMRQQLEAFLTHPNFEPQQRQNVRHRLTEWSRHGIKDVMRFQHRPTDMTPTDAHILENVLIRHFEQNMDGHFVSSFIGEASQHLGKLPCMHQVTNQQTTPKPVPHYEVITSTKTWKLRPGNSNILEAFAILLWELRRNHTAAYQAFPQNIRNVVDPSSSLLSWIWK